MSQFKKQILRPLASLRLTTVLLGMAMVLIFAGTLAQTSAGIWSVLHSYFRCFVTWIGPVPFPGGYTVGGLLLVNLIAAHYVRYRGKWDYAGISVLHAGLVLMLLGELATAMFAVEGNMTIHEGSWSNYIESNHRAELAIINPIDPDNDRVIVIPESFLTEPGRTLSDPLLPFTVTVVDWFQNSQVLRGSETDPIRATEGDGQQLAARRLAPASGVGEQTIDVPSAYLKLEADGVELGTWLVSLYLSNQQQAQVDGTNWQFSLRRERTYKPYTLHLIDFSHDKFIGTEMPRNYSSLVRIVDPSQNEDRETLIYMNHPLRYGGDTLFQASFLQGDTGTVLQVVKNPGWLLPYISCSLVSLGLLIHFLMRLKKFTKRARKRVQEAPVITLSRAQRVLPWAAIMIFLLYVVSQARPPATNTAIDLDTFSRIPVSADGRVKPLDTVARNSLMIMSDRQTFEGDGKRESAVRWLVELFAVPEISRTREIFRIDQPDVLALIGKRQEDGKRFSMETLMARISQISEQARMASQIPAGERNNFQGHILELYSQMDLYMQLSRFDKPYMVPPFTADEDWQPLIGAMEGQRHPAAVAFTDILNAYRDGDIPAFNSLVTDYTQLMEREIPSESTKASFEVFFNRFQPFYLAAIFYVVIFIVACFSYLMRSNDKSAWATSLLRTTNWLLLGTFIVHTLGLVTRIYLQGRPPVTNLYSSAVFIGWGCVLLVFFLERYSRSGLAAGMGSLIGFVTLIVAHNLSTDGDTMQMMMAVLDSNFWLSTHVTIITIGYSGTFLAGILGLAYILLGLFTKVLNEENSRSLTRMIFGILCFSLLTSFVGTVLGGIWADQSWGRFWGWDPKENGALLIVLWLAMTLHARMAGMIRDRGMAGMSIFGNVVTAWSWFGTNMLGVGLHSYGFTSGAALALALFFASQLLVIFLAFVPRRLWRSTAS
jgi:ABC-type transport system involved in cytochrome c biogenesis permease subunit